MDAQPVTTPSIQVDELDTHTTSDALVTVTEDAIITDMVHSALCQIQALGSWVQPLAQQPTA